jgi:hypothetical protein
MNPPDSDRLSEVDALVAAHLASQKAAVDGAAGLARVRAALSAKPARGPLRRRAFRLVLAAGIAAAVVFAFLGGWYLSPVHAGVRELVQETQRVHNLPLERCYLVEVQRLTGNEEEQRALGMAPRQVRVWTRGDRFWVEMRHAGAERPLVWGRESTGALWAVLDSHRGVRIRSEQAPKWLTVIADVCSLNIDTLLGNVLGDCTLTEVDTAASPSPSPLTRVVVAEPRSEKTRMWLGQATLEIDTEAKVLRRVEIARNRRGAPLAKVIFTLVETRPDDGAKYQLEGHLTEPSRIYEGRIEPKVILEFVARWAGPAQNPKENPGGKATEEVLRIGDVEGRLQTPLAQPDSKAAVLLFLLPDCPISNAYVPEIKRICADYGPKKIAAFVVHADPDVTAERAKEHAKEYGFTCPIVCDPGHRLVARAGVTIAPEVAVVSPAGKVLYRGRIDNWYASLGQRRAEPTEHDLRNALDAIVEGRAVPVVTTQAIGCYLPEGKK